MQIYQDLKMAVYQLIGFINMEAWKIIILVTIPTLLILSMWYLIKLQRKELERRTYVHLKTKHKYLPLTMCEMKCPVSEKWFKAVIYRELDDDKYFVMDRENFLNEFVKLLD